MATLNRLLTRAAEWLLSPFQNHAAWGLLLWSAVIGIVMTYVFGKTSNQPALRRAADTIRAQLFAVKLFKEDLLVTFQCQLRLLKSTGRRLLHSIPPMLFMLVPLLLFLTQLAMRYEFRPLVDGERAVVALQIIPDYWKDVQEIQLLSGEGYVVETPPLRDEQSAMMYWRIRAGGRESVPLRWSIGDYIVEKQLPVAASHDVLTIANPKRAGQSFWDQVLYPAEPPLADNVPIASIELQLTRRDTPLFGWSIPWWATFFVVSILVAFVAGKFLRVQY
jgi:hypothetical protein